MKHLEISPIERFFLISRPFNNIHILVLLISFSIFAQKSITNQNLIWYAYYNNLIFNEQWVLTNEIQERHFINPTAQHHWLIRANLQRNLGYNWSVFIGMAYFLQSPQNPEDKSSLIVPELRPYIGCNNKQKLPFGVISQRYKIEARFFHDVENDKLAGGYRFSNYRIRYQLGFQFPVIRKKKTKKDLFSIKIQNELFFNIGRKIVKNIFDQNRIYIGINYKINTRFSFEIGYMNWFQQRASGIDFYNRDIIRFSLFHTIFLKNK